MKNDNLIRTAAEFEDMKKEDREIWVADVKITNRWKTVSDSKRYWKTVSDSKPDGFYRLTTAFDACEVKERMELENSSRVKFRIKQYLGLYFIQARLNV